MSTHPQAGRAPPARVPRPTPEPPIMDRRPSVDRSARLGYSGGWQRGGGGGDWSLGGRRPGGRGSHGGAWRGGGSNRGRSLGGREQHPYHHRQQQREQLQADRVDFSRRISAEYSRYKSTDGRRDGRSGGGGSRGATDGRADENKRGQSASSSSSSSSDSGTGQQNGYQQHYAPPAGGRGRGRGSGGRGQRSQHQYLDVDSGATADEEGRSCNDRFKSPSPDRTGGKRPAPESFLVPANERPAARSRASPEHQSEDICIGQARGDGDAGAGGGGDGTGEEARIMRRKARKEKKNKDLSQSSEHKDDDTHRSRDKKLKVLCPSLVVTPLNRECVVVFRVKAGKGGNTRVRSIRSPSPGNSVFM